MTIGIKPTTPMTKAVKEAQMALARLQGGEAKRPKSKASERPKSKVTIFHENGKVLREVECHALEPYCNDVIRIVVDGEQDPITGDCCHRGDIFTNCPVIFEGECEGWDHMLEDNPQMFDVTMTLLSGGEKYVHSWKGAKCLVIHDQIISFYHDDKWVRLCGPVVIENMRSGK